MKVVPTLRTAEKPSIVSSFVLISISTASVKCKSVCVCVTSPTSLSLSSHPTSDTQSVWAYTTLPICLYIQGPQRVFPFYLLRLVTPFSVSSLSAPEFNTTQLSYTSIPFYWPPFPSSQCYYFLIQHQFPFLFSGFGINQCRVFRYLPALATLRTTFSHNW